jgi:hypothetical protein
VLSFYKNAYLKRVPKGATLMRKWAFYTAQMSYEKAQMGRSAIIRNEFSGSCGISEILSYMC